MPWHTYQTSATSCVNLFARFHFLQCLFLFLNKKREHCVTLRQHFWRWEMRLVGGVPRVIYITTFFVDVAYNRQSYLRGMTRPLVSYPLCIVSRAYTCLLCSESLNSFRRYLSRWEPVLRCRTCSKRLRPIFFLFVVERFSSAVPPNIGCHVVWQMGG